LLVELNAVPAQQLTVFFLKSANAIVLWGAHAQGFATQIRGRSLPD